MIFSLLPGSRGLTKIPLKKQEHQLTWAIKRCASENVGSWSKQWVSMALAASVSPGRQAQCP